MKSLPRDWPVVIYHDNCLDGFTSAYAAWLRYKDEAYYIPATYQEPITFDLEDRQVFVLDFSFKRGPLEEMLNSPTGPRSITIVDHHRSAIRDLEGLTHPNLDLRLDTDRSGAVLAWHFFHGVLKTPPPLFLHVQDRDLWRFQLNGTQEVNSLLMSYQKTFGNWNDLCDLPIQRLKEWGSHILRAHTLQCKEWCKKAWMGTLDEFTVPVINCPSNWASDIGNILCQGYPFSVSYYEEGNKINVSLRSDADGADVSEIASRFGGGGHMHAAGFRVPRNCLHFLPVDSETKV